MFTLISLTFFIIIFLIIALWILVPAIYGLPSFPTKHNRIRKALRLANLQPDEIFYDLGAGDGRVLLIAAREFGAQAIGIEIGPVQCAQAWINCWCNGVSSRVRVKRGNFFKSDLKDADVVFIYATSKEVVRLASHLEKQMKQGARVISISADFPEWQPSAFDPNDLIFMYEMPPKHGDLTSYLLENAK